MRRLAIALALVIVAATACGGKRKVGGSTTPTDTDTETTTPIDAQPPNKLTMQAIVSFGTQPAADHTKVWLVITDETAAVKSYPLDNLPAGAQCKASPGGEMNALGTLSCGEAGDRMVVARAGEFIVLARPAGGDYEEKQHIGIPGGAAVSFQP